MRAVARLSSIALLLLSACAEDRQPPPSDGTTTTAAATGSSSGEPMPDLPASDESTGPGWPLPTEDELLQCVRTCEGPWDCCPPGTEGQCPGTTYPNNYTCVEGVCVFPPCLEDDDCLGEGEACVLVRGYPRCVLPCDGDDAPCAAVQAEQTCAGTSDDGQAYCMAHCSTAGVFCGNQSCDQESGECVCTSAGQCQVDWDCV